MVEFVIHPNDDGSFTIQAIDLPIVTEGDTLKEAQDNALDALAEFGIALLNAGLLEQVLCQHGVTVYDSPPPDAWVPKPISRQIGESLWAEQHQLPVYA